MTKHKLERAELQKLLKPAEAADLMRCAGKWQVAAPLATLHSWSNMLANTVCDLYSCGWFFHRMKERKECLYSFYGEAGNAATAAHIFAQAWDLSRKLTAAYKPVTAPGAVKAPLQHARADYQLGLSVGFDNRCINIKALQTAAIKNAKDKKAQQEAALERQAELEEKLRIQRIREQDALEEARAAAAKDEADGVPEPVAAVKMEADGAAAAVGAASVRSAKRKGSTPESEDDDVSGGGGGISSGGSGGGGGGGGGAWGDDWDGDDADGGAGPAASMFSPPGASAGVKKEDDDECIITGEYSMEQLIALKRRTAVVVEAEEAVSLELVAARDVAIKEAAKGTITFGKSARKRKPLKIHNLANYEQGKVDAAQMATARSLE
jgi:hypothetical protein